MPHNNKNVQTHLSLPMWKIKQERDVTATLVRLLKPMSSRRKVATLELATVLCDEEERERAP